MSAAPGLYFVKGVFCQDTRLIKSQDRCTQRVPTLRTMPIIPLTRWQKVMLYIAMKNVILKRLNPAAALLFHFCCAEIMCCHAMQ